MRFNIATQTTKRHAAESLTRCLPAWVVIDGNITIKQGQRGSVYFKIQIYTKSPVDDLHIKGVVMLASLRDLNFGFWSRLGCSEQTPLYKAVKVLFRVAREEIRK